MCSLSQPSRQRTCVGRVARQPSWHATVTLNPSVDESRDDPWPSWLVLLFFFSHLRAFLAFLQHAVDAVSSGVSPFKDTAYNSSYWDKGSAFFFAGTVITTIGKNFERFHSFTLRSDAGILLVCHRCFLMTHLFQSFEVCPRMSCELLLIEAGPAHSGVLEPVR